MPLNVRGCVILFVLDMTNPGFWNGIESSLVSDVYLCSFILMKLLLCLFLSSCLISFASDELRDWQSADGKSNIKASLVGVKGGYAILQKEGASKSIKVKEEKLSKNDRDFLKKYELKQQFNEKAEGGEVLHLKSDSATLDVIVPPESSYVNVSNEEVWASLTLGVDAQRYNTNIAQSVTVAVLPKVKKIEKEKFYWIMIQRLF